MAGLESVFVWGGLITLALAFVAVVVDIYRKSLSEKMWMVLLWLGCISFFLAIGVRWFEQGHGPFITLYEFVLSQIWSILLVAACVYMFSKRMRYFVIPFIPLLWLFLGAWLVILDPGYSVLPEAFKNNWLWAHVSVGKVFLGTMMIAVSVSFSMLHAHRDIIPGLPHSLSVNNILDASWKLVMVAFVFHSLMLIFGAVWAQDAWGRYWQWDPLETSALTTWICMAISLHARKVWNFSIWGSFLVIFFLFLMGFTTLFGIPFLSEAAHKGIV